MSMKGVIVGLKNKRLTRILLALSLYLGGKILSILKTARRRRDKGPGSVVMRGKGIYGSLKLTLSTSLTLFHCMAVRRGLN